MRGLFGKQKQNRNGLQIYQLFRFWREVKMNQITSGLSRSQLKFSLYIFVLLGTVCCFFTAFRGVFMDSSPSIHIDGVSVVRPIYADQNKALHLLDVSFESHEKQAPLSRYIDSVIKVSGSIDLHIHYNSNAKDF